MRNVSSEVDKLSDVSERFPSADFDIVEAGKCLAFSRGTACVYHLMRVLERGLYTLADYLEIEDIQENWQNAIEQIEKTIKELDNARPSRRADASVRTEWESKRRFCSDAATHFAYVKDAWRNSTVHVSLSRARIYPVEDAQRVYENVKGFMGILATRLSTEPEFES